MLEYGSLNCLSPIVNTISGRSDYLPIIISDLNLLTQVQLEVSLRLVCFLNLDLVGVHWLSVSCVIKKDRKMQIKQQTDRKARRIYPLTRRPPPARLFYLLLFDLIGPPSELAIVSTWPVILMQLSLNRVSGVKSNLFFDLSKAYLQMPPTSSD